MESLPIFLLTLFFLNQAFFALGWFRAKKIALIKTFTFYHQGIQLWILLILLNHFYSFHVLSFFFVQMLLGAVFLGYFILSISRRREWMRLILGLLLNLILITTIFHLKISIQIYFFLPFLVLSPFFYFSKNLEPRFSDQMEFLVLRAILMMAEKKSSLNLFEWIAEDLEYLLPNHFVLVCGNDEKNRFFVPETFGGIRGHRKLESLISKYLIKKQFKIPEKSQPFEKFSQYGVIEKINGGIEKIFFEQLSHETAALLEKFLKCQSVYRLYFAYDQKCFGEALIFPLKKQQLLEESLVLRIYGRLISLVFNQSETWKLVLESEKRFREFTEFLPETVFETDMEGRFVYVNELGLKLTGYTPQELAQGIFISQVISPEYLHHFTKNMEEHLAGKTPESQEYEILTKTGEKIPFQVHTRGIFQNNTLFRLQGIAVNITEQKIIEKAMNSQAESLFRSNAELQHFAYMASHDLKEPLRMVTSYLGLLKSRYESKLDLDAKEFIGFAIDGAGRMQQLIDGLLSYSRIQTQGKDFSETDLNEVLQHVLQNLKLRIEETKADLNIPTLPAVTADAVQLSQLFQNLLENAMKFTSPGEFPKIQIQFLKEKDFWLFKVCDQGIGIPEEGKERIFEIFQRLHTRTEYPGTGIGLALCRRIIERHKGKIWVEPNQDTGTCFCFTLPVKF